MHMLQENSTSGSKSCHPEVFYKKDALKNFTKFTGKHLCRNHFFYKVAGLRPATLLKKRFGHVCFPVNIVKFLRSPFYRTHSSGCLELYQKALVEFSCEKYKLFSQKILHHRCLRQSEICFCYGFFDKERSRRG